MSEEMVCVMQSLGLDYNPAINSTVQFQKTIGGLNEQLRALKTTAMQSAKDINSAFPSQLGQINGNNSIVDQFGKPFKTMQAEAKATAITVDKMAKSYKESSFEQMKAQAASVQQRASAKGISQEYAQQATVLREQISAIQQRLQTEGKLTNEEKEQTAQLKEQLEILRAQTRTAISDDTRGTQGVPEIRPQDLNSRISDGAKFYAMVRVGKEAAETIKSVETGMINIQRVMDDSSFVFNDYRDDLLSLGVAYGQSFETVQETAMRWVQSGYDVAESLRLTETSLLALNAAELDATNATESMIGIMSQWNMEAQDLELVMDKINKTADIHSATSQDLVDGLLRSTGAARTMNMSLEDTIALIVNMREASGRTGKEVGNALNSIISYMQRPSAIAAIEGAGINMFADSAKTQFRNVMDIFNDMSKGFTDANIGDNLSKGFLESADSAEFFNQELAVSLGLQEEWNDLQKRDVSQAAAGVHRRNFLIGLMERMGNTQKALNGMIDAEGYSMRKNADTMESLEKKQESLKTSVQALSAAMGDAGLTGTLKGLAVGGTRAVETINKLPPGIKDLLLGTSNLFLSVKTLEWGMKTFGIQLPGISQMINSLTSGTWSLTAALKAGKDGMVAFASANAPLLALSATVAAIVALVNAEKRRREEQERLIETTKQEIKQYQENYDSAKKLYTAYTTAKEGTEEFTEVKKELLKLFPDLLIGYDSEGQAIIATNDKIEEQIRLLREQAEAKKDLLRATAEHDIAEGQSKINKLLEDEEKLRQEINKHVHYRDNPDELGTIEGGTGTSLRAEIIAMKNAQIADAQIKLSTASGKLNAELSNLRGSYIALLPSMDDMTAAQKKVADEFIEGVIKEQEYMEQGNFNRELYVKGFEKAITNTYLLARAQAELNSSDGMKDTTAAVFDLQTALGDMGAATNKVFGELKTLDKVIYDVRKGQKLSVDTILDLNEKYGLSLDAIELTTEGYTIEVSTLEELRKQKIQTALDGMEAEKNLAENVKTQVESRLENYGLEIEQLKNLTNARAIMAGQARIEAGSKAREVANEATGGHSDSGIRNAIYSKAYNEAYEQHMAGVDADLAAYEKALSDIEAVEARTTVLKGMLQSGSSSNNYIGSGSGSNSSASRNSYENKRLEESLKLLEHRKRISEESQSSIRAELEELKRINSLYVKTADERMDMAERLYSTEKRLRDRTLQDSVSFISDKKNFNEMSAEDEIKAWERVRENQVNNINAVKQANLELYKLKNQLAQDSYNTEENTIKHLTKLGVLSAEKQIAKYKELYETKVTSLAEEQSRVENLFGLYSNLIKEQQQKTKDAYDKRIEQIEEEAKRKKSIHEDEIKAIEKELDLLNRDEQEYDHDKKMDDLKEQLAYWQVRTSEDARKKVVELLKQIDEAEHKRKVELEKQSLEDKKKVLQDEVQAIDDTAKDEREMLEKSYKRIETAFDGHGTNIVALASTMSKEAYDEWLNNYIIPLQDALSNSDFGMADSIFDGLDDFIGGMEGSFGDYGGGGIKDWGGTNSNSGNQTSNPNNAQIYTLANSIANLKREYALGNNPDAPIFTKPLYEQLSKLSPTVSDIIRNSDYIKAADYVKGLPKMHKGGKSLSYGAVEMMPGELTFPPDLSVGLERLFPLLSNLDKGSIKTDNTSSVIHDKRVIQNFNSPLFNSEKTVFEDDVDERSFSREIQRQLANMV